MDKWIEWRTFYIRENALNYVASDDGDLLSYVNRGCQPLP